ncbi:hypothetical protein LP420_05990 [Massilia sp. B-10]|nr:hypothetical protein LP420_05990 [Massilia sp. B-10]
MHRTRLFRTARALVAIGLFTLSGTLRASGGDGFEENIFAPEHHVPESELQAYAMPPARHRGALVLAHLPCSCLPRPDRPSAVESRNGGPQGAGL